jgi:UDP-N-acetylmuramate dehydrogenase
MHSTNKLHNKITGELLFNESLAKYTSWRIGGPAKQYFRPTSDLDLSMFLQSLPPDEPLFWLGLGSNVLIRDRGFAGTVIHTLKMPANISILSEDPVAGTVIRVTAGTPCAKVAKWAPKHFVVGAEFFAGIPGTIGGALAMNAGAFGSETWQYVVAVEVINRRGEIFTRTPADYQVGYRSVVGAAEEWFLAAHLKFLPGDQQVANERIKELLRHRNATQPIGLPSCGSVFRNPFGKYAAELIEASKLKGIRIGNAEVSTKHANFIINVGNATASDVESLIKEVQLRVLQDHAIELCTEVKFIGD